MSYRLGVLRCLRVIGQILIQYHVILSTGVLLLELVIGTSLHRILLHFQIAFFLQSVIYGYFFKLVSVSILVRPVPAHYTGLLESAKGLFGVGSGGR